jgi:hypothetical protein
MAAQASSRAFVESVHPLGRAVRPAAGQPLACGRCAAGGAAYEVTATPISDHVPAGGGAHPCGRYDRSWRSSARWATPTRCSSWRFTPPPSPASCSCGDTTVSAAWAASCGAQVCGACRSPPHVAAYAVGLLLVAAASPLLRLAHHNASIVQYRAALPMLILDRRSGIVTTRASDNLER